MEAYLHSPIRINGAHKNIFTFISLSQHVTQYVKSAVLELFRQLLSRPKLQGLTQLSTQYLLTNSMVQSPSWAANCFAAIQEIPSISRNPKVHYCTHKRPPPVSILGQLNPVHIPTSHLLEIHPNIIHPSTPRSPQWFFPSGFPTKTLYTPSPLPIRATRPAHTVNTISVIISNLFLKILIQSFWIKEF